MHGSSQVVKNKGYFQFGISGISGVYVRLPAMVGQEQEQEHAMVEQQDSMDVSQYQLLLSKYPVTLSHVEVTVHYYLPLLINIYLNHINMYLI